MPSTLRIIVDSREPEVMLALLQEMGLQIERRLITPGDYIVSDECCVERKTIKDFLNSLFEGRLLDQMQRLKEAYPRPVLLLEGDIGRELMERRNPRAFWGALIKIELDLLIPTIVTMDVWQSADALYILAKRLQKKPETRITLRHKPKLLTQKDLQVFILAGLPGIGEELSRRLLTRFGSLRAVFHAPTSELAKVEGIGTAKAERITRILDEPYIEVP